MIHFIKKLLWGTASLSLLACTSSDIENTPENSVKSQPPKAAQAYQPTWESLAAYDQAPDWFQDGKFGLYTHWGPYAATNSPYVSDWYSRAMYLPEWGDLYAFHTQNYGGAAKFGFKDFIPKFTGEKFNAEEWADIYVMSGARFAGSVAEHSDGFAMWDSALTEWDAQEMGPRRDVIGELETAIKARNLKFLTSFHHHWNWGWYSMKDDDFDTTDPAYAGLYGFPAGDDAWGRMGDDGKRDALLPNTLPPEAFIHEWQAKIDEVVELYRPDVLWFDNRMNIIPERARKEVAANFYNTALAGGQEPVLTYKAEDMRADAATLDLERTRLNEINPRFWLTDTSIAANSWGYAEPMKYYSAERLLADLCDIVSKNGAMLLSLGPRADGTIPQEQVDRLKTIGAWLERNGEAIYGTRYWRVFGEGPTNIPQGHLADLKFDGYSDEDIRYTRSKDGATLYVIQLIWNPDGLTASELSPIANGARLNIKSVIGLDSAEDAIWSYDDKGLHIRAKDKPKLSGPVVYKVNLAKE